jgi:hypothetical protein
MIKVGYLVSYDYNMLLTSIKQLYYYVDKIVIAIDRERKTWSGSSFVITQSFFDEIKAFDRNNKIEFYFDTFYITELTPTENESRERNLVLAKLGWGWKIQLDVDEYIYDFHEVAKYLKKYWFLCIFPKLTPVNFKGKLVTLYRELPNGYLYIDNNEYFSFITNQSQNDFTRNNDKIPNHYLNISVIHQSWARSEKEIEFKIRNWGHRDDFDTMKYFEFWKGLNQDNYKDYKNVHPLVPEIWNKLFFLPSQSVDDFIEKFAIKNHQKMVAIDVNKLIKVFIKRLIK